MSVFACPGHGRQALILRPVYVCLCVCVQVMLLGRCSDLANVWTIAMPTLPLLMSSLHPLQPTDLAGTQSLILNR